MPAQFVYIAGPYTKGDVAVNVRTAILAGDEVAGMGFVPFIPHLTHFWHLVCPKAYEKWLAYDLAWLRVCHAVIRLPGESNGADGEVKEADAMGIPVFHSMADFKMACRPLAAPAEAAPAEYTLEEVRTAIRTEGDGYWEANGKDIAQFLLEKHMRR